MSASGARRDRSVRIDLLPPEPGTRRRSPAAARPRPEVVDAEFVVLPAAAAATATQAGGDCHRGSSTTAIVSQAGSLIAAGLVLAARLVERLLQFLPARAFGALVAAAVAASFFFAGGLSALATVLSGGVQDRGVRIEAVSTSLDDRDGLKVLSVYGTVANRSPQARPVPAIVVDVIAGGRSVARHRIEPEQDSLPAGATNPFRLRIPHGGANMPKVAVSFVPAGAPSP